MFPSLRKAEDDGRVMAAGITTCVLPTIVTRSGRVSYDRRTEVHVRPCSNCGHRKFRRVRRQGLLDSMMVLLRLYPWECESCQHRMYSRRRDVHEKPTPVHEGGGQ